VLFAGGRFSFPNDEDAKTFATNVWDMLDRVHAQIADMVPVHGGDAKGVDRLSAAWAERRSIPQIASWLDSRLGQRPGFRRNKQMLSLKPRCLVAFAGNGVLERLVIQAKEKGVPVVGRRGPLGANPKRAARLVDFRMSRPAGPASAGPARLATGFRGASDIHAIHASGQSGRSTSSR
jgi:hypothetical protein